MRDQSTVVLFDGICNLCTWTVRFIVPRDPDGVIQFASLQSTIGQQLLAQYGALANPQAVRPDSVVLIEDGQIFFKSEAALRIARHLNGIWAWAWVLRFIPRPLRDGAYDWLAAHRYQIFGQRDTCLLNIPANAERFLDSPLPTSR